MKHREIQNAITCGSMIVSSRVADLSGMRLNKSLNVTTTPCLIFPIQSETTTTKKCSYILLFLSCFGTMLHYFQLSYQANERFVCEHHEHYYCDACARLYSSFASITYTHRLLISFVNLNVWRETETITTFFTIATKINLLISNT